MSEEEYHKRLENVERTKICLRNFMKLKNVWENLEKKQLELKTNQQKIKAWRTFKNNQRELLHRRNSVIAEVSFFVFFNY